jgi:tetratricopeptide (TPR) repeat protein
MKKLTRLLLILLCLTPAWAHTEVTKLQQAQAYFEKKSYKKCISICDKILDQDPRSADAYFWKGRALEAQKKPLEAANEYQAAILARDNFTEARDGLTRVSSLLGNTPPAEPAGSANQ